MDAQARRSQAADELLEQFRLADRAEADGDGAVGRHGPAADGGAGDHARPRVLFLDEPTAGLDPQSRIALWEILGELHGDGQTILLTTHYMEEADQLCDRVAIMDHGRILALDTPAELKRVGRRRHRSCGCTADGDLDALAATSQRRSTARTARRSSTAPCASHVRGARASLPRVIDAAEPAGFDVTDLSVTEPTLETVFINLTGKDLRE